MQIFFLITSTIAIFESPRISDKHSKMSTVTSESAPLLRSKKPSDDKAPRATAQRAESDNGNQGCDSPIMLGIFNTVALIGSVILLIACIFFAAVGMFFLAFGMNNPPKNNIM